MAISLVQSKTGDNSSSPTTLTVTLTSATTAGNCLVVCAGVSSGGGGTPTITAMTLGGSAGNFAQAAKINGSDNCAAIWTDQNCAGGQTSVAITQSGSLTVWELFAIVFEFSGIAPSSALDKTSTGSGTATTYSSGTTATTTQASEVFVGLVVEDGLAPNSPASPWTNTSFGGSSLGFGIAGWQVVSSTGTATYSSNGTFGNPWAAAVITLKGSAPSVFNNSLYINQAVRTAAYY